MVCRTPTLLIPVAEVFLAAWRVTSCFYGAEIPKRIMFRTTPDVWQDPAGLVNWIHGAILPHTSITDLPKGTVMFDKVSGGVRSR